MIFAITPCGDGRVLLKGLGAEPYAIAANEAWIYTVRGNPRGEVPSAAKRSELVIEYGAVSSALIRSDRILLASPSRTRGLRPLAPSSLWQYVAFVDLGQTPTSEIEPIRVIAPKSAAEKYRVIPPKWKLGMVEPKLLAWGLSISYGENPKVTGLYIGDANEQMYYPEVNLGAGIHDFLDRLRTADVVVTNSSYVQKLRALELVAATLNVEWKFVSGALFTSVEELSGVAYPGLSWEYPLTVQRHLRRDEPRTDPIPPDYPESWWTDWVEIQHGELYYAAKARTILRGGVPILAALSRLAIHAGVDLRCTLRPEEFQEALFWKFDTISHPPLTTYLSPKIADSIASSNAPAGFLPEELFFYDLNDYLARMRGNSRAPISPIGVEADLLESDPELIGIFNCCVVRTSSLGDVRPLFVAANGGMITSGGIYAANSDGEYYGAGTIGFEGSQTRAIGILMESQIKKRTDAISYSDASQTSYSILVEPHSYAPLSSLCKQHELSALRERAISIPIHVWMGVNGKYDRNFNRKEHLQYNGSLVPKMPRQCEVPCSLPSEY